MGKPPTAVVVVSHYNAWPADQLVALLDQIHAVPAGLPFAARVVVNRAQDRDLALPPRLAHVEVVHRENTGYNIGAWDAGWRRGAPADFYLFLQEECQVRRPGWLRAFVRLARRPRIGLVGESMMYYNCTWEDADELMAFCNSDFRTDRMRARLTELGIPFKDRADHLQSLVLCARRDVLEAIDGFPIGIPKDDAILCELGISKRVQHLGLQVRQLGILPFQYISHPQWHDPRAAVPDLKWRLRRFLSVHLLADIQRNRRTRARLLKAEQSRPLPT